MQDTAVPPRRLPAAEATVIVPVYNEATVLGEVLADLHAVFETVVCVDDASRDGSAALAEACGAVVLRHPVNLGQGAALQTGLTYALEHTPARVFLTFDADGQHDPQDARALAEAVLSGRADVALGSRFLADAPAASDMPRLRRLLLRGGVVFTRLTTRLAVTDTHNGLRAVSRDAARLLDIRQRGMAHASELLRLIAVHRISYVEVPVHVRYTEYSLHKGQSGLNAVNVVADVLLHGVFRRS